MVGVAYETRAHPEDACPEVEFDMCTPEQVPIPEGAKAVVVKGKETGGYWDQFFLKRFVCGTVMTILCRPTAMFPSSFTTAPASFAACGRRA